MQGGSSKLGNLKGWEKRKGGGHSRISPTTPVNFPLGVRILSWAPGLRPVVCITDPKKNGRTSPSFVRVFQTSSMGALMKTLLICCVTAAELVMCETSFADGIPG